MEQLQARNGEVKKEQWHVGKEIPVAVVFALCIQTAGAVWWAAVLTTKIDELSNQVAALTLERYTKSEARRDLEIIAQRMNYQEDRLRRLEDRRGR